MTSILRIGRSDRIERELYFLSLPNFDVLSTRLVLPSRHFAAFVAGDAMSVDPTILRRFARLLIESGCVYFCSWGPDCERVHDIFDEVCDPDAPVIMTTWHDRDSLDGALWFFVSDSHPDAEYDSTCGCGVAISVGDAAWAEHIRERLADIEGLKKNVFNEA